MFLVKFQNIVVFLGIPRLSIKLDQELFLAAKMVFFLIASRRFKLVLSEGSRDFFHLLWEFRSPRVAVLHFSVHQGLAFSLGSMLCFGLKSFVLASMMIFVNDEYDSS